MSNKGMSRETYDFIETNTQHLKVDLDAGIITTPRNTNGTLCSSTGYLRVKVKGKSLQVHQILAQRYFGEGCVGFQVNHIDGDKTNNRRSNLQMVTQKENIQHGFDTGLYEAAKNRFIKMARSRRGAQVNSSKLTEDGVRLIRNSQLSGVQLAEMLGVSTSTVSSIRRGQSWKHVS